MSAPELFMASVDLTESLIPWTSARPAHFDIFLEYAQFLLASGLSQGHYCRGKSPGLHLLTGAAGSHPARHIDSALTPRFPCSQSV